MKTFFVITILFVFLSDSISFAQTNCYTPPTIWYRVINQPVYKWYWDGQLNGAAFDGYDHILSTEEKQTIVKNAIRWAVNAWKSAVNAKGIVIEDMSESSDMYGSGFHFYFGSLSGQAGRINGIHEIQLASNVTWSDVWSFIKEDRAIDIKTVILHEIGHIFLGEGHSTDDGSILMWDNYRPFRDITSCDRQALLNLYPLFNITIDNNFSDNTGNGTHGKVKISNYLGDQTAPITIKKAPGQSVTLTAISPQTDYQNYQRIWHTESVNTSDWKKDEARLFTNQSYTFTVTNSDNNTTYQAQLRKICSVNFQNRLIGIGNGGLITVNGTSYNSPTSSFSIVELNPITAAAHSGQIFNGIEYTFSNWNDGNTTANRTFNPSSTATYSAYYIGKPATYDPNTGWEMNLHHSTTIGQPIVLYWNEHPNTYVTKYQIWKKEKYDGVTSAPILMATVNRGTTSYVDDEFVYSLLKDKYWIYYTVVPYYSLENTYGVTSWMPVTAEILPKTSDSTFTLTMQYENTLSNYPNPFNPVTNIKYSIKEPGFVNIKVFDLVGQLVAELVNEEKQAGEYSIQFNAASLPSGIYFYTINSGAFIQTRKMLLMK